jgi:HK97 family phage portal protein
MGILNRMRGMIGMRPNSLVSEQQIRDFLRGGGNTNSGVVVNEAGAMRVASAWRCVNIIAGSIATLPLDLIRRVDENVRTPAVGHQLRRVLTVKPNPWQTPSEFRRMMQANLLLRGNAYARKVTLGNRIEALIPLHPDRVEAKQIDTLAMEYEVSGRNGSAKTFAQKEILHLRGMSLDGVTGMSVLSNMRESLGLALQTERAGASLFKNGMLTSGYIAHPGKLSDNAAKHLKESINEKYSGAENSGKWLMAEEGMELKPLSLSAEDTQWLGARDFQRYDIAMFFGVPPHMIGATEKTTSWGTGIEAQGTGFVTYTLSDWIKTWEESIKRDLMQESEWETLDARFNVNGLLRGDAKARWEGYVKALQWGVYSPNEVRRLEDQNPRDGGDVYYDPPNTAGQTKETENEPAKPAEN